MHVPLAAEEGWWDDGWGQGWIWFVRTHCGVSLPVLPLREGTAQGPGGGRGFLQVYRNPVAVAHTELSYLSITTFLKSCLTGTFYKSASAEQNTVCVCVWGGPVVTGDAAGDMLDTSMAAFLNAGHSLGSSWSIAIDTPSWFPPSLLLDPAGAVPRGFRWLPGEDGGKPRPEKL